MLNSPLRIVAVSLILSLASVASFAAEDKTPEQVETEQRQAKPANISGRQIEQIDVVGQRTLMTMRHEILREEDNLYRLFNDLNAGDKYDIFCKSERRTNSYIAQRSCEPVFLSRLIQASARNMISETRQAFSEDGINWAILQNGLDKAESAGEIREQAAGDFEAMNQEILRIAMENPAYFASLQKVSNLKAAYQAARETRFGK